MTEIYKYEDIINIVDKANLDDLIGVIEDGFVAYSQGKTVVPPVGELLFKDPPGALHIKYGYIKGDEYFTVKIVDGFYDNYKHNLSPYSGLMLLFSQKTGQLESILLDEMYLTHVRTALAGAVVAKYLAPKKVECIGVFGAGTQGKMQVEYLKTVIDCKDVYVWGVTDEELKLYKEYMTGRGYTVKTTKDSRDITDNCNLIITATPSKTPVIAADQIKKSVHITAMGSDTGELRSPGSFNGRPRTLPKKLVWAYCTPGYGIPPLSTSEG